MAESLDKELTEKDKKIHGILTAVCHALHVPIELVADGPEGRLMPYFDINGINSKITALMVYVGANIQPVSPPYNRVHADVEFWKKIFETVAVVDQTEKTDSQTAP